MIDREKVISGLYKTIYVIHNFVPNQYWYDTETPCDDAITLLKTQEPKTTSFIFKAHDGTFGNCPTCGAELMEYYNEKLCGRCGQAVKWE